MSEKIIYMFNLWVELKIKWKITILTENRHKNESIGALNEESVVNVVYGVYVCVWLCCGCALLVMCQSATAWHSWSGETEKQMRNCAKQQIMIIVFCV